MREVRLHYRRGKENIKEMNLVVRRDYIAMVVDDELSVVYFLAWLIGCLAGGVVGWLVRCLVGCLIG